MSARLKVSIVLAILFLTVSSGCVPYGIFSREMAADKEVLVSGVWFEGAILTDPRPAESKYFKVYEGGFKSSRHGARYWLLADIIHDAPHDLWAVVEADNPFEHDNPFVEEGLVKVTAKSFFYDGSSFVLGLKMFETYSLKVTLYDSKDKKEVLDQFTQKIKAYVDTTGSSVLIAKGTTEKSYK